MNDTSHYVRNSSVQCHIRIDQYSLMIWRNNMISFTTGEIQLFHSKYILSPSLDRLQFEKTFPNRIINYYDSHTGCYHYPVLFTAPV